MNLFSLATDGVDLDALPLEQSQQPRASFKFAEASEPARLRLPRELDDVFGFAAQEYGVDVDVLRGIAYAESRFNPDIISGKVKSPAGAIGLMQFMPETAQEYGIDPTDPVQAIMGGAAYLRKSLDKFDGDYERAVASYNWGPNRKAYDSEDWASKAPQETQKYLMTVFGAVGKFKDGASERGLPQGVAPSKAGAGRGSVSPGMTNTQDVQAVGRTQQQPTLPADTSAVGSVGSAINTGLAKGVVKTGAGLGTFLQDPGGAIVSGLTGGAALLDRGMSSALSAVGIPTVPNQQVQRNAQIAAESAQQRRGDRYEAGNPLAVAGRFMEEDSRRVFQELQEQDRTQNPRLIAQQKNLSEAEGFVGNLKAAAQNPIALAGTLSESIFPMAAGVGAGSLVSRLGGSMGAVSATGTASEAGFAALNAREGVYQAVATMPLEKLAQSPRFQEILRSGNSPTDARELLANELADQAPLMTAAGTAGGTLLTNRLFGGDATAKTIAGTERMTGKELGKRVAQDTVEEVIQGVPEDLVQYGTLKQADPTKKLDLAGSAAQNMVGGFAFGVVGHGGAFARDAMTTPTVESQPTTPQAPPVAPAAPAQSGTPPVAPTTPAAQGTADAIMELERRLQAAANPTAQPTADAGTTPVAPTGNAGATEGAGGTVAAAADGQPEQAQALSVPENFTATPAATVGTQTSVQAGPGFTGKGIAAEMAALRARSQPAPVATQPATQQAEQPRTTKAAQPAKANLDPQGLLSDDERQMLGEFTRLYQTDLKADIRQRLGMTPKEQATAQVEKKKPSALLSLIVQMGGIKSGLSADLTGANAMEGNRRHPGLFRNNGKQLDVLVQSLKERGYLTQADEDSILDNGGTNKLADMIQAELSGERAKLVDNTDGFEAMRDADMRQGMEDKATALGLSQDMVNSMSDSRLNGTIKRIEARLGHPIKTDFATRKMSRAEARAEREAILMADRYERARAKYDAELQAFAEADDMVQDAVLDVVVDEDGNVEIVYARAVEVAAASDALNGTWSDQNAEVDTRRVGAGQENSGQAGPPVASTAEAGAGNPEANRSEASAGSQETLTTYTPEEVTAQQEAAEKAERTAKAKKQADDLSAKKEQERKEIAQASVAAADTFELGQDAMANLTGQQDVFGAMEQAEDKQARVDGRKAAGKVAPAPVAAQQTVVEAPAKRNATQTADATSKPDGVAGDAASRPTTHTNPVEYVAKLNREIPAKAPDEKPTPDTLKAAASIPTFQGGKTKMARAITEKVRQYWGGNASKIDTIIDYFGGSGSWGAYMAGAAFPNVKRLVIHEFNPERLHKIRLFNERGNQIEQLLAVPEVKAYFDAVKRVIQKKRTFSGSAIANVVASSNERVALRKAARDAVGADVFDGLLQAIQDQGNASFGKYGKGESGSDAVDDMLRRITSNAGQAYAQMQSLRERGASIEYVTGNSYEAKQTPGKNVLAMVDPPYYATKGYNGVSLVGINTYNDTRKLLDRLKSSGNSVIYTDEAWWEKHDKNTGRTIVPPDAGNQVDGLDAFGQLSSIKGLMGDFFRMPIATRMEVVGFIDGNRNAGTIGRSSSADDRQAQRAGQAGENAGGLGTGAGQQAGGGMAKRNDRVSEGQPAKPGRLNPSTGAGAGKADARNAALTSVVRNGGNSTAVLTDIAKNSTNPAFKLVAKAILAKGSPFDLRIRTDFTDGKLAHYSTDGHFVEFDPGMPFNLEQVLLHEAVHAVTSKYVASFGDSTPLGKELAALFKLAEQHAKKTGAEFYGLTNADEFLAEVMTNGAFAQWLDTVPVPLQKSALSRFVRAVARFFGIQKADGATTQAMDVFERIMRAQSDLQAEANQRLSTSKDAAAVADAYGVDTEEDGDSVYFGDAEVSLNREDNTYIVTSENEFTPDHRAAVAWAENNGFTSELAKSPSSKLTPVESMLRDALEATGDMGAAKDMAYEALRRQGVSVKWQDVVDAAKKMGRGTRASKPGADAIRSDTDASPRTPASTIRAAITKAYGNLLDKLEGKGLVTIAQTEREAIEAAAQARADKTGGDVEQIKRSMLASVQMQRGGRMYVDPDTLIFREDDQNRAEGVSSAYTNTEDMPAIVVIIGNDGEKTILDGHNRASVALSRGDNLAAVSLTQNQYDELQNNGYDDIEIAYATLRENNENDAADDLESQFPGAGVAERGRQAWINFPDPDSESAVDVKYSANGNIEGFFDKQTGKSFLVADNLTAASAPGTLMHEVGIHMAADGKLEPLFNRAAQLLKLNKNNPFLQRVQARMDQSGETSAEEAAAYSVTEYENDRANAPASVAQWVKDFIADVRAWLFGKGVLLKADQLTVADIAAVARANAKSMAMGDSQGDVRNSKAPNVYEWADRESAPVGAWVKADYKLADSQPVYPGNSGQFDTATPDIRRSISNRAQQPLFNQTPAHTWEELGESYVDTKLYNWQDDRIDLKRVQESITKAGRQIDDQFDARTAETLLPGRLAKRTEDFMAVEAAPLLKDMAKNNVTMEEVSDYMLARHAPERNAQIAKVNPDMPDAGSGTNSEGVLMTTQAANDHIAALTTGKRMVLEMLARRVDAITKGTRDLLVAEGLEKAETIRAWEGAYKHYVPLFRDEAANTPGHPVGSGISVTGSASKRATGSSKEVTNMLAHVLMQREAAITRAEKNRVGMSLYGMALSHPNKAFWSTVQPKMSTADIVAELQRMGVDPMDGIMGMDAAPTIRTVDDRTGLVVDRPNPMYKKLANAIVVKVNGEDRVILFNTKNERAMRMAESLKNQHFDQGMWVNAANTVAPVTRFMSAMMTQYNPAFGMVNAVRDIQGALVNLTSTPLNGKQARVLADTPAAVIGIARDIRGDGKRTPWSDLWVQFQEDGGRTGYRDLVVSPYERAANMEKDIKRMQQEGKWTPGNAAHAVLDLLGDFNDSLENGVRLAAYKAALDKGMTRPQAAKLGRELTVDFNRKGRKGRELGKLYAFLNASIQGNARNVATVMGAHGGKVLAGGFALGVLQALMLAWAGYEDDEIREFQKARALIIPIGGKQHITIPMALGFHIIPNTSRILTELMLTGGKDWQTKVPEAMFEIANAANPFGGGGDWKTAHGPLTMVMPTAGDWAVDLALNRDFTGNQISRTRYNERNPGSAIARESTLRTPSGQVYQGISKAINDLTGGSDRKAGAVSPTPEELRYIMGVVGGGVYRETEKAINAAVMLVNGDEIKATQVPLGSRFVSEVRDEDVQRSRYYKNSRTLEGLEADLKDAAKDRDSAKMNELRQDKLTNAIGLNNAVQRHITQINKMAKDDIGDKAAMAQHDANRAAAMRRLNDEVLKLEKQAQ